MSSAKSEAEYLLKQIDIDVSSEANSIVEELDYGINEIEDIRDANSTLRDWGNEEFYRAEEAERERDELLSEKEDLQEEVEDLKATINAMEELENDSCSV